MSRGRNRQRLPYEARARIADNVFLLRKQAGYSQADLAELSIVTPSQIGKIERGDTFGHFDTYIRLAGALSVSVHDLLAGVTWRPAAVELEISAAYEVKWETNGRVRGDRADRLVNGRAVP
jgi:transcriptional regulator with XRE-family HTH domain